MPMITIRYVTPQPRPELRAPIAAFVQAALGGMAALLGPLHAESYVHVLTADGDAYGYGGRTQNARWSDVHR